MRRRKGNAGGQRTSKTPSEGAQQSATLAEAVAGRAMPDHELTVLGFGNVTRYFDLDEPSNGPAVVFRGVAPYASFFKGYSAVDSTGASQDIGAATDTSVVDPTDALYPVTRMAWDFQTDVWPILSNLFSSGTGSRATVSINEFIRYQAMLMKAYAYILTPVIINHLTYHYDWSKVAPFTSVVPKFMYDLASNLDATDVGLAETYLPLLKRFDNKIAFPNIMTEMKRVLTPMLSVDLNGRLQVPLIFDPSTVDSATVVSTVTALLDYIDVTLESAGAVFTSFLPFPVAEMNPWGFPQEPVIDVDRDSGLYNSNVQDFYVFGDTGDPTLNKVMMCDEATTNSVIMYTRHTQPIWSEVKMASIFRLTDDATDDEFQLITPHLYYHVWLLDDSFDSFAYDGSAIGTASVGFRYLDYANCRFASTDVDYGTMKPGLMGAEISQYPLNRLMRIETAYCWSLDVLKLVTQNMAGASIRELRYTIKAMVVQTLGG
jgi:hypothetical protein